MAMDFSQFIGKTYNHLNVLELRKPTHASRKPRFKCLCSCGKIKVILVYDVISSRTKSCGHLSNANPDSAFKKVVRDYLRNCHIRGRKWLLSEEEAAALFKSNCHYCGSEPSNKARYSFGTDVGYVYNGIDRIDNDGDYTVENTVACCQSCNFMKGKLDGNTFLEQVKKISKYQEGKENDYEMFKL